MGDGVGVPAFGEHRHADDAFDVLTELAGLADGVHDLAEQVFLGQLIGVAARETGAVFGFELLDLAGGDLLEFGAHPFARFELFAVDQDRVRARAPCAALLVVEERQPARHDDRFAVGRRLSPSRRCS